MNELESRIAEVKALTPKFEKDKNEAWMKFVIPKSELVKIESRRRMILGDRERLEILQRLYRRSEDPETALSIKEEKLGLLNSLRCFIDLVRPIKENALKAQKEHETNELLNAAKMIPDPSEADIHVDLSIDDLDLYPDDYMPAAVTVQASNRIRTAAKPTKRPPLPTQNTSPPKVLKQQKKADKFLDGVSEDDAEFLIMNRSIIEKYACRDRLMSILASLKTSERLTDALDSIYNALKEIKRKK